MAEKITVVSRDSFARADVVRRLVPKSQRKSCEWCGSRPGKFQYGWDEDQWNGRRDRIGWSLGYCCKSCHDASNN